MSKLYLKKKVEKEPAPAWAVAQDLSDAPAQPKLNIGQRAATNSGSHVFDDRKTWDERYGYPGSDDDRSDWKDGQPPHEWREEQRLDYWIRSKTPMRRARVLERHKYDTDYTPVLRHDVTVSANDLNALATFAATIGAITPDLAPRLVRNWLYKVRSSSDFSDNDTTPTTIAYRAAHRELAEIRAAAIKLDVAVMHAADFTHHHARKVLNIILRATS